MTIFLIEQLHLSVKITIIRLYKVSHSALLAKLGTKTICILVKYSIHANIPIVKSFVGRSLTWPRHWLRTLTTFSPDLTRSSKYVWGLVPVYMHTLLYICQYIIYSWIQIMLTIFEVLFVYSAVKCYIWIISRKCSCYC